MRLALLAGNRFSPWHLRVFERLRPQPEVIAFRAESEIQRHFTARGADTLPFPVERIFFDTQCGPRLRRLANALLERYAGREPRLLPFHERLQGFDLIQTWELFPDWTAEALEARKQGSAPLCAMIWDNIPFNMERDARRRAIKRRALAEVDRFIVHSDRSRRMLLLEGANDERISKIEPGVDTSLFSPGPRHRGVFGMDEDSFVILFVGWFLPRKGLDFLLLALKELLQDPKLRAKRPTLLAIGSGPGKERIDGLVSRLELGSACCFPGALPYDMMPEAFRAADVLVLPSIATPEWQEQFGMTLIEAMACGVPVVSTHSGAIPEIVGDAGVLCQPNDFASIADALRGLMNSPELRQDLAGRGRDRALARFTMEAFAAALSGVYDRAMNA